MGMLASPAASPVLPPETSDWECFLHPWGGAVLVQGEGGRVRPGLGAWSSTLASTTMGLFTTVPSSSDLHCSPDTRRCVAGPASAPQPPPKSKPSQEAPDHLETRMVGRGGFPWCSSGSGEQRSAGDTGLTHYSIT